MAFVSMTELLQDALNRGYALPAFNAWTYQDALAYVKAAGEAKSPLIIQTSGTCIAHNGLGFAYHMVENAARTAETPIVIHLDHARTPRLIFDAIYLGYNSVMFDGSNLGNSENIETTKIIKAAADAYGVSVEAEIGHVPKGDNDPEVLTTLDDAVHFLDAVNVDVLAVAAGTRHGMQKRDGALRFDVLETLSKGLGTPMALHGSSGVSDNDLPRVAASGVCKVNIATRLRRVFIDAAGAVAGDYNGGDHIEFLMTAYDEVVREAVHIMALLGSAGKA